jgi:hypothetical protein
MINNLHTDIQNIILSFLDFKKLNIIYKTCKNFNKLSEKYFDNLAENDYNIKKNNLTNENISSHKKLSLVYIIGCQRCNKHRIRKIYHPFLFRICKYCFDEITIRDYSIPEYIKKLLYTEKYKYMHIESWSRCSGSFFYKAYLKSDIMKLLKNISNTF